MICFHVLIILAKHYKVTQTSQKCILTQKAFYFWRTQTFNLMLNFDINVFASTLFWL